MSEQANHENVKKHHRSTRLETGNIQYLVYYAGQAFNYLTGRAKLGARDRGPRVN